MLAILLSLGTWQVHRLAWKRALLARIDVAETADAVPLGRDPPPFAKVRATGVLGRATALYGVELRDTARGPVLGVHVMAALIRHGLPSVLVDRGWVDAGIPLPASPPEEVAIFGYVRAPERAGWFSAADDPVARRFFTLDPAAIGAALGQEVAPFTLVAMGPAAVPDPARHLPRPPNDHLGYAITWYGFALTLATVFVLYARRLNINEL